MKDWETHGMVSTLMMVIRVTGVILILQEKEVIPPKQ